MQIQSFKEILPHWELADTFSAIEAAALISGFEPTSIDDSLEWFKDKQTGRTDSDGIHEFTAALNVLLRAIGSGSLKADSSTGHLKVVSIDRGDLVEWMQSKGGRFRPAFFFPGEQDSGESAGAADRHRLRQLEAENAQLVEQVAELQRQLQEATAAPQQAPQEAGPAPQQAPAAPQDDEKPLHPRREKTYLNTIGALVELIQSPRPGRGSDTAVIRELLENYGERPGISERTLQSIFPAAKKSVQSN